MPFVTLNGVTIPTAKGGEVAPEEIGETMRSYDGTTMRERRAVKRRWRFRTVPVDVATATALRGLIQGLGHYWPFTSDDNSEGGLAASTSTAVDIVSSTGADGDAVEIAYTAPATYSSAVAGGTGAAYLSGSSSNLLSSDESDMEGAGDSGWNAIGTGVDANTILPDTDHYWESSQSLKITTGTPAQSANTTSNPSISSATDYTGSIFLKGASGGESVKVQLVGDVGGVFADTTFTLQANKWTRCASTGTSGGSDTTVILRILNSTGSAQTWYQDGAQVEALNYPTWWLDGGTSRAADSQLLVPSGFLTSSNARGFTLNCWASGGLNTAAAAMAIELFGDSINNRFRQRINSAQAYSHIMTVSGSNTASYAGGTHVPGAWNMMTSVYDRDAATLKWYLNGTLVDTVTSVDDFPIEDMTTSVAIGSGNVAGVVHEGGIDEVQVLPYPATAALVTGWYNSGTSPSISLPRPYLSGDCVRGDEIKVAGTVTRETYTGTIQNAAWDAAARVIEFVLAEV
jgi:hypothetical protein